jgi:hypothetical protein
LAGGGRIPEKYFDRNDSSRRPMPRGENMTERGAFHELRKVLLLLPIQRDIYLRRSRWLTFLGIRGCPESKPMLLRTRGRSAWRFFAFRLAFVDLILFGQLL